MVAWISPTHVFSHISPCAAPESSKICGDRNGPLCRGQQGEPKLDAPAGKARRFRQAVEELRPRLGHWHWLGVIDRGAAAWKCQMGGKIAVDAR